MDAPSSLSRYRLCRMLTLMLAGLAGLASLSLLVASLFFEASAMIEEFGAASFVAEGLLRLGFGLVVALLTAAPYLICCLVLTLTRRARTVASFALVLFLSQLACYLELLLVETSSTAALGFLTYPIIFCTAAILFGIGLTVFTILARDPEGLPTAVAG